MAFVYLDSEPGLYTVGHYDPAGHWHALSDHSSEDEAAERCRLLNGGAPAPVKPARRGNGGPYIIGWHELLKVFVVREISSEASYDLPDGYIMIDDSGDGLLDCLAEARRHAQESGWRNYTIQVEG